MYESYFGLSEIPFSITPDPRYLYLSKRHREAMAHLLFGVRDGGGFVQLTGEVGTGKTTLCRCILEQMPANVEVALILNPQVNEHELLATICDELRINYPQGATAKELIDKLTRHLLKVHAQNKKAVLIVDEAQNLSRTVMEQIRLLTNLETPKQKLLRIVLIGQPELIDKLSRSDLRQLAQRITTRYHLGPMSAPETAEYIIHRIAVAGCKRQLFRRAALRRVHKVSGGIPRLVNIICDHALLGAYSRNKDVVSAGMIKTAAAQVQGVTRRKWSVGRVLWAPLLLAAVVTPPLLWKSSADIGSWMRRDTQVGARDVVATLPEVPLVAEDLGEDGQTYVSSGEGVGPARQAGLDDLQADGMVASVHRAAHHAAVDNLQSEEIIAPVHQPAEQVRREDPESDRTIAPVRKAVLVTPSAPSADEMVGSVSPSGSDDLEPRSLESLLTDGSINADRAAAVKHLVELWGATLEAPTGKVCEATRRIGLTCLAQRGTWNNLRNHNRAAILTLRDSRGHSHYAAVTAIEEDRVSLFLGNETITSPPAALDRFWHGEYMLLWRPPPLRARRISVGSSGADVIWLRHALAQAQGTGFADADNPVFDDALRRRVLGFQRQHALKEDGIVGVQTLIAINTVLYPDEIPLLVN